MMCEGPNGAIWFGGYYGDLIRFDFASEDAYQRFNAEDGIDQGVRPNICVTKDGTVWVVYGDNSKSINRFDGEKWEALEVGQLGRGHHYTSIIESRDGTLWIGGSRLIAHQDGVWRVYNPKVTVPLPSHRTKLLESADGTLWIIGRGQEAARLDLSESHYQTYEGLIFQCDTTDGAQWFLSQDNGVVRYDGQEWMRFGVEDGLMDTPSKLIVTRRGALWATGSHEHVAATARLDGSKWIMKRHSQLSRGIDPRAVYEAFDGTLWFAAAVDWWLYDDHNFFGGVVAFDGTNWTHHTPSDPYAYGIGQSSDGTLWFGGRLVSFDGTRSVRFTGPPEELAKEFELRPSRTGYARLIETRDFEQTVLRAMSVKSCVVFDVRISSCALSARSCQKQRANSQRRPTRYQENLRVRESALGTLAYRHAMPNAECFPQWVLCLASTSSI